MVYVMEHVGAIETFAVHYSCAQEIEKHEYRSYFEVGDRAAIQIDQRPG